MKSLGNKRLDVSYVACNVLSLSQDVEYNKLFMRVQMRETMFFYMCFRLFFHPDAFVSCDLRHVFARKKQMEKVVKGSRIQAPLPFFLFPIYSYILHPSRRSLNTLNIVSVFEFLLANGLSTDV